MNTVFFDSTANDEVRRWNLYNGEIFVFSPCEASIALCKFAHDMVQEAFGALNPEKAQHSLAVEQYAAILAKLKPTFINHSRSKQYIQKLLGEMKCDLNKVHFDVPRMRTSPSGDYLTTGIAYAWHPHRDTWYSAPQCQLNWWIPIYDIESENAMAFHPRYWSEPVRNDSNGYNYYQWNQYYRPNAAQHLKQDSRPLPRPVEPVELHPQLRVICPAGGIIIFSGAQLHSTVPNTSGRARFSIDFRTVHLDDVVAKRGAPNIDSACTGTTMRDYLRATDLSRIPDDVISLYDDGTAITGELVYQPRGLTNPFARKVEP